MFTLQQLKAAHSKVRTGADFPAYIQEIKALGLLRYEFLVKDGSTVYYGDQGHEVKSAPMYPDQYIKQEGLADALKHSITIHQQGQTDFLTFCHQAAEAGVERWVIDTEKMLCSYLDKQGDLLVAEPIPQGDYV